MSEHRSGGPISISIDVNGNDNQPEWGWCRAPECENEAMPIWFEGGPDGDPDLLLCPDCIGLEIVHLRSVIARVARQLPGNPDAAEAILSEVRDANDPH